MSGEYRAAIEDVVYSSNCKVEDVKNHDEVILNNNNNNEITTLNHDPLYCTLCNIKVTSTKILQRHIEGRKHRMKVERQGKTFICELCDIVANSETQLNIHLNSSRHKNRLWKEENKDFTNVSVTSKGLWIILFCALCLFINLVLLFKVFDV